MVRLPPSILEVTERKMSATPTFSSEARMDSSTALVCSSSLSSVLPFNRSASSLCILLSSVYRKVCRLPIRDADTYTALSTQTTLTSASCGTCT